MCTNLGELDSATAGDSLLGFDVKSEDRFSFFLVLISTFLSIRIYFELLYVALHIFDLMYL